jgi:benzoyl-CoA reductase/2-hydroxyglutaryl-CoA dehydratase subunit BcrC/BadD/HgdB
MKQTLEEWKTEYITKEKIEDMMSRRNITEEKAVEILNRAAEEIYSICWVQPMNVPTGIIFKLKHHYD